MITALWLIILGAGAALELYTLGTKAPGDTLSEHVWRWFQIKGGRTQQARRAGLLLGMVWLTVHFLSGGWV